MLDSSLRSNRPDLSRIHWFKRLTLILLSFMFGTSIAVVIGLQFFWMYAILESPFAIVFFHADAHILQVTKGRQNSPVAFWYEFSRYELTSPPDHRPPDRFAAVLSMPGMCVYRCEVPATSAWHLQMHHAWLICLTASAYLFARFRIRRAARKLSLERPSVSHV